MVHGEPAVRRRANKLATTRGYRDFSVLLQEWEQLGPRDSITVAEIPAGSYVEMTRGQAAAQIGEHESLPAGGTQYRFNVFHEAWIRDQQVIR